MLVLTGNYILLPGNDSPRAATIEISSETGKITAVHNERRGRDAYPSIDASAWIDAGDKFILPGLVEYVSPFYPERDEHG